MIAAAVLFRALFFEDYQKEIFSFSSRFIVFSLLPNLTFLGSDWIMFFRQSGETIALIVRDSPSYPLYHLLWVPQAWSIGIEISFYALAPFIVKRKSFSLLILTMVLFLLRFTGFFFGLNYDPWTYRFFPFELPLFLLGILTYRLSLRIQYGFSASVVYSAVALSYLLIGFVESLNFIPRWLILFYCLVLAAIILLNPQRNSIDRKLGDLSYPIYMIHIFILSSYGIILKPFSQQKEVLTILSNSEIRIAISFGFCLLFSQLLLKVVHPIEKIRDRNRALA
jgi:peptidoglycan/LPS O-acetylase OafA/YrhL